MTNVQISSKRRTHSLACSATHPLCLDSSLKRKCWKSKLNLVWPMAMKFPSSPKVRLLPERRDILHTSASFTCRRTSCRRRTRRFEVHRSHSEVNLCLDFIACNPVCSFIQTLEIRAKKQRSVHQRDHYSAGCLEWFRHLHPSSRWTRRKSLGSNRLVRMRLDSR